MTASISAISTMPDSPNGSQRCRLPSSRARCGITAIRSTFSAASSRSSRDNRSINSKRRNLLDPLGMTTTKFFLTDPAERARYAQPLRQRPPCRTQFARRHALGIRRRRPGLDHCRFCALRADAAQWRHAGRQDLSQPGDVCRDDHGPYRARIRRRPQLFLFPGDGFGFGYGFGIRTDPGNAVPPPPGSPGEIKWDGATGVYIVVDRAQDMFFVVMQNAPSGRWHVQVNVKKIIYDAFEK